MILNLDSNFKPIAGEEIKFESEYYGLCEVAKICDEVLSKVEFVSFESSGKYSNCGTHKVSYLELIISISIFTQIEDIKDKNLTTGICVQSPYYITIELNAEHEFEKIEINVEVSDKIFGLPE